MVKRISMLLLAVIMLMQVTPLSRRDNANAADSQQRGQRDFSEPESDVLDYLSSTLTAPAFGNEWVIMALARGGKLDLTDERAAAYYANVVEYVNEKAVSIDMNGALDKSKSTDNSRLIIALSSIGKNARSVGDWDLISAYEENGLSWITKQGINGAIYALIALDTADYALSDESIRDNLISFILEREIEDGGFAFSGTRADPDVTALVMTALAKYTDREDVSSVVNRAVEKLSVIQNADGTYTSWGAVASESSAQVICALSTLGINPDTDERFIKDGHSVIDGMLTFYLEDSHTFAHTVIDGTLSTNGLATIQCGYAMVAYQRMINGRKALFDMTDVNAVTYDNSGFMDVLAILTAPASVTNKKNTKFTARVLLTGWDMSKHYKLMDAVITIPAGITVTAVNANEKLTGGTMYFEQETASGKLRIVYADLEGFTDIAFAATDFPAELFTIDLALTDVIDADSVTLSVTGLSLKLGSDSQNPAMMHVINTAETQAEVGLKKERAVYAYIMYTGDGIDLIPENMQAVAILVTETDANTTATYNDMGLLYSAQLTEKTGVTTYVAMMSTENTLTELNKIANYTFAEGTPDTLTFGDVNNDGVINAQDALNTVNAWMRKGDAPAENTMLAMNVNGDSRINTFDALGIVDFFVNGSAFIIVANAQGID